MGWSRDGSGRCIRKGSRVFRPVPHFPLHPRRILRMLRENLEEEAVIMKDVPNWKVGPQQALTSTASHRRPGAKWGSGYWVWGREGSSF